MIEVPLHGRRGATLAALVDEEDLDFVSERRWYLHSQGYAIATNPHAYMHGMILGCVGVDHRDGNRLNNTRANLRPATQAQNLQNRAGGYGRSRHRGVVWFPRTKRWKAQAKLNGKHIHLGCFLDEEEAARVAAAWRAAHMPYSTEAAGDPDAVSLFHTRPERAA